MNKIYKIQLFPQDSILPIFHGARIPCWPHWWFASHAETQLLNIIPRTIRAITHEWPHMTFKTKILPVWSVMLQALFSLKHQTLYTLMALKVHSCLWLNIRNNVDFVVSMGKIDVIEVGLFFPERVIVLFLFSWTSWTMFLIKISIVLLL